MNAFFGGRRQGLATETGVHGELEVETSLALVAVDLPGMDRQFAECRVAGDRQPLAGRVDQVADLSTVRRMLRVLLP